MVIDQEKCIGCGICIPYCPVQAIALVGKKAVIDHDTCLECGNCIRSKVVRCPRGAIYEEPGIYETPRAVRRFFSDPMTTHKVTKVPGRGTEEVKTNDVTGRVCRGEVGIALEIGRPCLGATMADIERITMGLAELGIKFEECNPLTHLMADREKGIIAAEYKGEKVVSAIVEFTAPFDQLKPILTKVKELAAQLDTVFSLDLICCYEDDGTLPALPVLAELGIQPRVNAKVNLGLGRPYKIYREQKGGCAS
ncbi:4Fe-4S binding protein [Sporolituus thermophilus]|uniref:4Fe-4S dicluster domain-containing protein n=1 Tax=Sporolituus thermophilus DSM 23256 TaxID=1123285 RepID=A0A1G7JVF9_9FIRM|nr:4Fe-4S binding protein [Sporolituus thermophilus]SDF28821.1 4Fe-4S dicluster domain-containing protein [Sporolituus thermophilus DSM 23256]